MPTTIFVFYFFLNLFFNWSIIALQCCVSFSCTTKWISCMYIYIPSLLSLPPSQVITETQLSSLCYTAASQRLFILHMVMYMCQCYLFHLSHPLLPLLWTQVRSLCFYSYSANRFICTIPTTLKRSWSGGLQQLRIHLPMQGTQIWSLVRELGSHVLKHNYVCTQQILSLPASIMTWCSHAYTNIKKKRSRWGTQII